MEVEPEYLGALIDLDYSSLLYFVKKLAIQHYNKQCMYTEIIIILLQCSLGALHDMGWLRKATVFEGSSLES